MRARAASASYFAHRISRKVPFGGKEISVAKIVILAGDPRRPASLMLRRRLAPKAPIQPRRGSYGFYHVLLGVNAAGEEPGIKGNYQKLAPVFENR